MSTRVLHLINAPECGWPAFESLATLVAHAGSALQHTVALIGGADADRCANDAGLSADLRIAPPLGRAELAAPRLRELLRSVDEHDLIHAWSPSTLTLARLGRPRTPRCATLGAAPPEPLWSLTRIASERAALSASRLMCASQFALDRWRDVVRVHRSDVDVSLLPYPLRVPTPDPAAREKLRDRWGVGADIMVVIATGEPLERLDARWHTFRAGVLAVGGCPSAIVLPSRSDALERALRYTERHFHAWRLIVDDAPLRELAPGADIALWRAGPDRSGTEIAGAHGLALCASAGIPCVAERHPLSEEVAASFPAVRLSPRDDSVAISRALFETVDEVRERRMRTPAASTVDEWIARMERSLLRAAGSDAPFPQATGALA